MDMAIDKIITEIGNCNTEEQLSDKIELLFNAIQKDSSKSNTTEKETFLHGILSFLGGINSSLYNIAGYKILKQDNFKDGLKILASSIFRVRSNDSNKEEERKFLEEVNDKIRFLENENNATKQKNKDLQTILDDKREETDTYITLLQCLLSDLEDLSENPEIKNMKDHIESTLRSNGISVDWNVDENRNEKFDIIKTQIKRNRKLGFPCLIKDGRIIRKGSFFEEL